MKITVNELFRRDTQKEIIKKTISRSSSRGKAMFTWVKIASQLRNRVSIYDALPSRIRIPIQDRGI